jgi:hypothetical protein
MDPRAVGGVDSIEDFERVAGFVGMEKKMLRVLADTR